MEHRSPVVLGHLLGFFLGGIVVLRERQGRLAIVARQLGRQGVVVLRLVLAPTQRTPVGVLDHSLSLHLEDLSLVLIWLSLPFAPPKDVPALFPVGRHLIP